ncbi:MAG: ATP-binding cassette domain-containing protein [Alphaproteobacteria bacterium]|nr:ATP-binding cassette domain-containing protein [Alphaproteobacteria bacterium]MBL6672358.1 ATP-binding cassette domain-containing protein [Alphaproteobacteria bacterium]HAO56900.1 ABC transporter ATP-binding protein [Alphaproteobacteria bacterium]
MPEASRSDPKIRCRGLWKLFGTAAEAACAKRAPDTSVEQAIDGTDAIIGARDVNIDIARGELFVIMGLSGSGKSTVLRCIAQLHRPSSGDVWLDDANLAAMPESSLMDIRRHRMGMVFQNFGLVPHFTALQNIAFPLKVRGEAAADCAAKAAEMLSLVGLDGRGDAYPSELSGGQQQRVGIARSLAVDPEVWLLDEPFSALDPLIRKQLQDELLALQARLRKTIIFVTHDFSEAVRLADRIAIMRDGRIIQQGRAAELLMRPADDYVSRFVGDVSRLQVLRLGDVMQPATTGSAGAPALPATTSLEDMLMTTGSDVTAITVVDADGQPVGTANRQNILDNIRNPQPAPSASQQGSAG